VPDIIYQIQDALADRYSIKRELGKGGMATGGTKRCRQQRRVRIAAKLWPVPAIPSCHA